jgi:hypothetical protein
MTRWPLGQHCCPATTGYWCHAAKLVLVLVCVCEESCRRVGAQRYHQATSVHCADMRAQAHVVYPLGNSIYYDFHHWNITCQRWCPQSCVVVDTYMFKCCLLVVLVALTEYLNL